jgi:hypothetical protein
MGDHQFKVSQLRAQFLRPENNDSNKQLTVVMYALTGLGSRFGNMHNIALLHVDSEERRQ